MALGRDPIASDEEINKKNKKLQNELTEKDAQVQKLSWNLEVEEALEGIRNTSMLMQHSDEIKSISETFHKQLLLLGIPSEFSYVWLPDETNQTHQFWASWSNKSEDYQSKQVTYPLDKSEPYTAACFKAWETPSIILEEFIPPSEIVGFFDVWSELLEGAERLKAQNFPDGIFYAEAYMKYGCFGINIVRKLLPEEKLVLKRFSTEFERAYTRFLDLKKAETQAFEARIETALEKVRSRGMGMQSSDELSDVIKVVYEQLANLNIELDHAGFVVDYQPKQDWHFWITDKNVLPSKISHPYFESIWASQFEEAKQKGHTHFFTNLDFDQKNAFYDKLLAHVPNLPDESKTFYANCPGLSILTVVLDNISLYVENFNAVAYSKEDLILVSRFAKVFQLTYTRFLDLQKAEQQAREAQIQLALERVRAQTMAMHSSNDLERSAEIVFEELDKLDLHMERCGIGIFDRETLDCQLYTTVLNDDGETELATGITSLTIHPMLVATVEAWKSEKPLSYTLEGSELEDYYKIIRKGRFPLTEELIEKSANLPKEYYHYTPFSSGGLYFFSDTEHREQDREIMARFAEVFDMTYTRFLDLKKAEAQAREAKIETALEKVRSRTMAMQHSDELQEASYLLDQQVRALGIQTWGCAFNIYGEKDSTEWFGNEAGVLHTYTVPRKGIFKEYYEKGQKGESLVIKEFSGKACVDHYEYMSKLPVLGDVLKILKETNDGFPTYQIDHVVYFKYGYLLFITREDVAEAHDIFKRFAKVFEQTYTRFLDLKKAEAQARESQIELSLERIRARVTAMQESSDLLEIVVSMRSEFVNLGHEAHYFWHMRWNPDTYSKAMTSGDGSQIGMVMTLPRHIHGDIPAVAEWEKGIDPVHVLAMDIETAVDYVDKMIRLGDFERVDPQAPTLDDIRHIGGLTFVMARTTHGEIGYSLPGLVPDPPKDAVDSLVRFASIFDLAYRRFEDLKKAEAQARENRIELALERIRGQVTSMEESSDLFDIVVSMRREFLGLGHQADYFWHMRWLPETYDMSMTSEDGNRVGMVISIPKFVHDNIPSLAKWEKSNKPSFALALDPKGAWDYIENMNTHGRYEQADPNAPTKEDIEHIGGLTFIIARTSHGEIGYSLPGEVPDPPEDAVETLIRFAKVFDLAYKRFEDLKAAEKDLLEIKAARKKAEDALKELKETQTQLIQQEKLASLGQLTAGIAHEIKNPLNFVNNFSEVSLELIQEAVEEIKDIKSDERIEEAMEILSDVEFNLKKIHEHGSRANGIVSSMLLHSRGGSGKMEPSDLNALIKEYVNLSFHGMRAGKEPINVDIQLDLDPNLGDVNLISEDFSRVILNICNNAFDAMRQKTKDDPAYLPILSVSTESESEGVRISIADNGPGIPDDLKDKILQPFFTTKKGKEGTGLGLSITHDIIKAHGGELNILSSGEIGTKILIDLRIK